MAKPALAGEPFLDLQPVPKTAGAYATLLSV
jgi:hypothetical protein